MSQHDFTLPDGERATASTITPGEDWRTLMLNSVSWGAVLAGVVVSLVIHLLLNLLGVGIGAATLDPVGGDSPTLEGLSMSAAIWWIGSGIVAALVGGLVAGRLSGRPKPSTAAWHGVTAWALTTLLVVMLVGSAVGGIVGGAFRTAGAAAGGLGRVAETAAPMIAEGDLLGEIEQQVRQQSGGQDPAALRDAAASAVRALLTGDEAEAGAAREQAAQALARAQGIPIEQAREEVARYEQDYRAAVEDAERQAVEAAEVATRVVSQAAIYGVIALVLGGLAGWFGGRMGTVRPTVTLAGPVEPRLPG